jgi:hypothetical protein
MSDWAWFCVMIIIGLIAGNAPDMIRAWRCKCDSDEIKP